MKILSILLAVSIISILVFNNIYQIGLALLSPTANIILITGFITIFLGVTIYANHNRKILLKWN